MSAVLDPFVLRAYGHLRRSSPVAAGLALDQAITHPVVGRVLRGFAATLRRREQRSTPRPAFDHKAAAAGNDE